VIGFWARTAASFWVFLTLGTTVGFFCRVTLTLRLAALRGVGFLTVLVLELAALRLATGFLLTLFRAVVDFEALRTGDLVAIALFTLGRAGLAFKARLLFDDFVAERRAPARDADRLKPFVTALLMESSRLKGLP
jgi:hypothetical protein